MRLSAADIDAVERELCRRSLAHFARRAWHVLEPGTPLKWGWALDAICAHLEAVTDGKVNRLLMNVPPGTMKSLLTGVIWPAWEWGPRGLPHLRYVSTSHSQNFAIRDATKSRRLIKSAWYQRLWPVALMADQDAKTKFENEAMGAREAMAFTSMTGGRGDRVILDDPISAHNANSAAHLWDAEVAFTETLPTRVNNDQSAIIVIMQRLHDRDVSGLILSRGLPYVHLCLPMRFEADRRCVTPFFADPRQTDGELLFPDRFSAEQVAELESTMGSYAAAGQLQQRPTPRGGGIFKAEWWRYYTQPPAVDYRSIYADTAQKTGQANDYSVFECWGHTLTGQAVLLDVIRGKWESPELLVQARAFWAKHSAGGVSSHRGPLRAMKVEDKVSGTGLIQTLRREGIPVTAIQRDRDKVTRSYDAAPLIESGNVLLPQDAPWLSDFLAEASAFPNAAHDDMIDPMMDAVTDMLQGQTYSLTGVF